MNYRVPLFLLFFACAAQGSATAAPIPQGSVVLARGGSHAVFIWDASTEYNKAIHAGTSPAILTSALEADALQLLLARLSEARVAKSVTIRAVFTAEGAVDPRYGTPTLGAAKTLFVMGASRSALLANASKWLASLRGGAVPPGLAVTSATQ